MGKCFFSQAFAPPSDFQLQMEHAYLIPHEPSNTNKPAPVIVKFLSTNVRDNLLHCTQQKKNLSWRSNKNEIILYPDYTKELSMQITPKYCKYESAI